MMKVVKWSALVLLLAVAGLLVAAAMRPDTFIVTRSRVLQASPERLLPLIEDLRAFNTWNPFVAGQPEMPLSYEGPAKGPGAVTRFGPGAGGEGTLTRATSSRAAGNRRGLRVLGRVGVGRTTQVVAVQFADKVFLLAASDQAAPSVLAELELDAWNAATEQHDDEVVTRVPVSRDTLDQAAARPSGLLESLREATTRRG